MRHLLILPTWFAITALALSCASSPSTPASDSAEETPKSLAQQVVDQAIAAHGGAKFEDFQLEFRFRDITYRGQRQQGRFQYERLFEKEGQQIHDVLTNDGFERSIDGEAVQVVDSMAQKYTNSVNSVWYFSLLPFGLNDPAVNKTYLGTANIKGIAYHKIQVDFQEEGGGVDFDDVFVYWIHPETHVVDYLAYSFRVDGGGLRFREAYEPRSVGGIRLQNYVNYQANPDSLGLKDLDAAFEAGKLKELSKIELEAEKSL